MNMSLPPGWSLKDTGSTKQISFSAAQTGMTFYTALTGIGVAIVFCLYQILISLQNWFVDQAEILPAGVVFFLILCGALFLCWKGLKTVCRSVVYTLNNTVEIQHFIFGKATGLPTHIDKQTVQQVLQVVTPASSSKRSDIWRTAILVKTTNQKSQRVYLEEYTEAESQLLGTAIAAWAHVAVERENSRV